MKDIEKPESDVSRDSTDDEVVGPIGKALDFLDSSISQFPVVDRMVESMSSAIDTVSDRVAATATSIQENETVKNIRDAALDASIRISGAFNRSDDEESIMSGSLSRPSTAGLSDKATEVAQAVGDWFKKKPPASYLLEQPPVNPMSKLFTMEEVSKHNTEADCWIVIDSVVYDVTKFLKSHPGGRGPLLSFGGHDATSAFFDLHKKNVLLKYDPKLRIGIIKEPILTSEKFHDLSLIDTVTPFAETTADRGWQSPYYTESHLKFRKAVRAFYNTHIIPDAEQAEESGQDVPIEMFKLLGKSGILACRIGHAAMPYVKQLNIKLPGDLSPDQFDYFHELIAHSENHSIGMPGYADGLGSGFIIGLPPVLHFGKNPVRDRVVSETLLGEKRICLAISEAGAGSDVAGLVTTAKLNQEETHYIVNGHKKWITNGHFCDYFVTAVRTGQSGPKGISLLLCERPLQNAQGIMSSSLTTQKMKTSYSPAAGTALVIYDNLLVPKENLLGKENEGFKLIMANFNHERWMIALSTVPLMRIILSDCFKWAMQRKVFGKRLIDQPVIRFKLAQMTAGVESCQAWLDSITYQMNKMSFADQNAQLAGPIALLKYQVTRTVWMVCDSAAQIFGGRAITRTGMGANVERIMRGAKIVAIYGGSEEIVADLAVRQSVTDVESKIKNNPKLLYVSKL